MESDFCPHFVSLSAAELFRVVSSSRIGVSCVECGVATDNWVCLSTGCFFVGCGRNKNSHAREHYSQTLKKREEHKDKEAPSEDSTLQVHPLCFCAHTQQVWCYECDDEVEHPILAKLRSERSRSDSPAVTVSCSSPFFLHFEQPLFF